MEYQSIAPLGKVNVITDDDLLGQRARFLDLDYASTEVVKPQLTHDRIEAILCRNESGGTLAAGLIVDWKDDAVYGPGRACDGAGSATTVPAGVVDPWISAAVPDNGFFWLILNGPCKFLFTTGTTLDEADLLASGASGRAIKATVGTTSDHYSVGTCREAVDTAIASDTLFRGYAHFKFA